MTKRSVVLYLSIIALLLLGVIGWYMYSFLSHPKTTPVSFAGQHIYGDVQTQINFGSRIPGPGGTPLSTPDKTSVESLQLVGEALCTKMMQ